MMRDTRPRYWFHAKRYGWGWGLPARWQGWLVMALWLALAVAGAVLIAPRSVVGFVGWMLGIGVALMAVCWAKGEPTRWRWG